MECRLIPALCRPDSERCAAEGERRGLQGQGLQGQLQRAQNQPQPGGLQPELDVDRRHADGRLLQLAKRGAGARGPDFQCGPLDRLLCGVVHSKH